MTVNSDVVGAITAKELRQRMKRLLSEPVVGLEWEDKIAYAQSYLHELAERSGPAQNTEELKPVIEIVPPEAGHRPLDEALSPGHGCSEHVAFVHGVGSGPEDSLWLLYRLEAIDLFVPPFKTPFEVHLSAAFLPIDGGAPCPVPSLQGVPLAPSVVSSAAYPDLKTEGSEWAAFNTAVYAAEVAPGRTLLPARDGAAGYRWDELPERFRALSPDGRDPFTFASQFKQRVRFELSLVSGARVQATDSLEVEVFDTSRFGSLYQRLMESLVQRDVAAQAARLKLDDLHVGHHPWFPVLCIGTDKARLYLRGVHQDLRENRKNLPDPGWLLRVGLYLELLTCLGIFEAVRDEYPDLLSPVEREVFENSPWYAPVRERLDVAAWRKVWALREIAPHSVGNVASAGPVSLTNLLRKQRATLAFLHAHHEDLKGAIELAGANLNDSQETWHRVFRDAERAVLRNSLVAFPELTSLSARQREFALWHQQGDIGVFGHLQLPQALTGLFGDQDAVYPSACRQYRASMNEVARWARERKLMAYTGPECVPPSASLFEAHLVNNQALLAALQRRDGYGPTLELDDRAPSSKAHSTEEISARVRRIPLLHPLTDREIHRLAARVRQVSYGPNDRVVVQGQKGSSLFLVVEGNVEVLSRRADGEDAVVATLGVGAVFGEFALLTGDERAATVRSLDGEVVLYEIQQDALRPILEARPQVVTELGKLMVSRQGALAQAAEQRADTLADKIRRFLLG